MAGPVANTIDYYSPNVPSQTIFTEGTLHPEFDVTFNPGAKVLLHAETANSLVVTNTNERITPDAQILYDTNNDGNPDTLVTTYTNQGTHAKSHILRTTLPVPYFLGDPNTETEDEDRKSVV